jgi:hypothetical protein
VCHWDAGASVHNMVYSNSVSTCTRHPLKGQCREMDIFLKVQISTFYVCVDGFQVRSKAFHYHIQLLTFYLLL